MENDEDEGYEIGKKKDNDTTRKRRAPKLNSMYLSYIFHIYSVYPPPICKITT